MQTRRPIIVIALIAILFSTIVLYVEIFGSKGATIQIGKKRIYAESPYKNIGRELLDKISDLKSFQAMGNATIDFSSTHPYLNKVNLTKISVVIDLSNNILKIDGKSNVNFLTNQGNNYSLLANLKRISAQNFYAQISQANISEDIKSFVERFFNKWIVVNDDLMNKILPPEEMTSGFNEENFLKTISQALKSVDLLNLTRKIKPDRYEFVVTPDDLAAFLARIFGDLSGKPFSKEEVANLSNSLSDLVINGEIQIDPISKLPSELVLDWSDYLQAHLYFSDFDKNFYIKMPSKSVLLENLLQ